MLGMGQTRICLAALLETRNIIIMNSSSPLFSSSYSPSSFHSSNSSLQFPTSLISYDQPYQASLILRHILSDSSNSSQFNQTAVVAAAAAAAAAAAPSDSVRTHSNSISSSRSGNAQFSTADSFSDLIPNSNTNSNSKSRARANKTVATSYTLKHVYGQSNEHIQCHGMMGQIQKFELERFPIQNTHISDNSILYPKLRYGVRTLSKIPKHAYVLEYRGILQQQQPNINKKHRHCKRQKLTTEMQFYQYQFQTETPTMQYW